MNPISPISFAHLDIDAPLLFEDSFLISNFAEDYLNVNNSNVFTALSTSAHWTEPSDSFMRYRGHELHRQKAFWTQSSDPLHKYSYPGFQYESMLSYEPIADNRVIDYMVKNLQRNLRINNQPVVINHVIGTRYRGSSDSIGFHSDKTKDITPNSPIISLSFGETRELHMRRKGSKTVRVFVLQPGDLFVLGYQTNLQYEHSIVPVSKERRIRREPGVEVGPRISLVFRDIATTITRDKLRKKLNAKRRRVNPLE